MSGLYTCINRTIFKCNFLETACPILTRFHIGSSVEVVISISNGSALLNKMAAMPIYGNNS